MEQDEEVPRRTARWWFVAVIAVLLIGTVGVVAERGARAKREQALREAMHNDLTEMRRAIRDFWARNKRLPRTLQELVAAHNLTAIPEDPVTRKADWHAVTEQQVRGDDFAGAPAAPPSHPGVADVRSAAPGTDGNGKAWSEY